MPTTLTNRAEAPRQRAGHPPPPGAPRRIADNPAANPKAHPDLRVIEVRPLGPGWTMRIAPMENDLVFLSGRAAEDAALRLADRLATARVSSVIRVHLRNGALGGRVFRPALGANDAPPCATGRHPALALAPA